MVTDRYGQMEKIVEQGLLYDFYGELLTEHQKKIFEDAVYGDLSLSEIAAMQGISRQGVHDLLKRSTKILESYENKLHLVEKFVSTKDKIREIGSIVSAMENSLEKEKLQQLTKEILEDL